MRPTSPSIPPKLPIPPPECLPMSELDNDGHKNMLGIGTSHRRFMPFRPSVPLLAIISSLVTRDSSEALVIPVGPSNAFVGT